ncbi:hypothetical protein B0T26DRAFT_718105 [Lasiosphaeria miniovina]|uniref:Uncharacterized protein n=1 Tax=Lasiosphaeria miniovina TaxID=1954250 RepID=A0AA40AD43_9PEZI|nr:uncharacterized protein B0T26DRAFT_718105 [Lasiosphaeria miniovina]KAK0713682.1 hypothetical protein B0T26DRAFT_718105 [Lasiosphaeria miniovina]
MPSLVARFRVHINSRAYTTTTSSQGMWRQGYWSGTARWTRRFSGTVRVRRAVERVNRARAPKIPAQLVAEACVLLVVHPDSRLLSGRYVDLEEDVDSILDNLWKGANGDCVKTNLESLP